MKNKKIVLPLFQIIITAIALVWMLDLWRSDLRVPFNYWGDTLYQLSITKSLASGGWIWNIPDLGAPYRLDLAAFPQNISLSSFFMKIISLFTSEPGLIINSYWLISILLTSVVCFFSLQMVGISQSNAMVLGALYALMPYAFYRNIAHISLTYIYVPIICAFCILQCMDNGNVVVKKFRSLILLSAIFIGFDYIYTAFFSCLFILFAILQNLMSDGATKWRKFPLVVILIICSCVAINALPSFISWQEGGIPQNMNYKNIAESETYGLKIRHMLVPLSFDMSIFNFPLENENQYARLGVVGALGCIVAVLGGLLPNIKFSDIRLKVSGYFVLIGILVSTIGGFGAIINMIIGPDIRAYSRIIVFLGFFSFYAFGLILEKLDFSVLNNSAYIKNAATKRIAKLLVLLTVLVLGLYDQRYASASLRARYDIDLKQMTEERSSIEAIQRLDPKARQIYQLPETVFPPDPGINNMLAYDHARPHIWSNGIRWSWPSFSIKRAKWFENLGNIEGERYFEGLAYSGFDGIWVDTYGYTYQKNKDLKNQIERVLNKPIYISSSGRYEYYSMLQFKTQLLAKNDNSYNFKKSKEFLQIVYLDFDRAFYSEEENAVSGLKFRWSKRNSEIKLVNTINENVTVGVLLTFNASAGGELFIDDGEEQSILRITEGIAVYRRSFKIGSLAKKVIKIKYAGPRIDAPGDSRDMYFAIINPKIEVE